MAATKISWCDRVWNPIVGCSRVSAGCELCYAEAYAPRLAVMGRVEYEGLTRKHADGSVNWTGEVRCLPERLGIPLRWRKPARIFVNSMSDLFHEQVADAFIDKVFAIMALCPQHTFQVLTKRPERMRAYLTDLRYREEQIGIDAELHSGLDRHCENGSARWPLPLTNVWLGVSAENQATADERVPLLLQAPAAVRFVSAEPLLGPIDFECLNRTHVGGFDALRGWQHWNDGYSIGAGKEGTHLDWLIVGGESGPNRRPFVASWACDIRDQCVAAGVPFFYKQGSSQWPGQFDQLDGRQWKEFPA